LDVFDSINEIDRIILVIPRGWKKYCQKEIIERYGYRKDVEVANGGARRQDSVACGLGLVPSDYEIVIIHDGVRPFVTRRMVVESIAKARKFGACIVAVPVSDTVKMVMSKGIIDKTLPRESLWRVQTPQTFRLGLIKKAYAKALKDKFYGTDDAQLVERMNKPVKVMSGDYRNIKITTKEDLVLAESILSKKL
ncbi:2-C-methyl-D-erythritol 4-phosphate cytidylyltransferase, partial [bacterium]|nr:2-C-methyl-D-erythritol 4-phosphate cytidylyltransferase [bacterium]NIO73563.1 2-C-methyl-D-erythritol 4-phosphate cytidylyltransferase [bacterium]